MVLDLTSTVPSLISNKFREKRYLVQLIYGPHSVILVRRPGIHSASNSYVKYRVVLPDCMQMKAEFPDIVAAKRAINISILQIYLTMASRTYL